jgi:hypothetical protein
VKKILLTIFLFLPLLFVSSYADTSDVVIGGNETVRNQKTGFITDRSKLWGTYQVDGKRLYYGDFVSLYRNSGDHGLAGRYKASVWLRYVVPYIIMFGTAGVGIANDWPSVYLLPGLGLGIATGFIGKAMFVSTINDYNYQVGKNGIQTGLKITCGYRYNFAISMDM